MLGEKITGPQDATTVNDITVADYIKNWHGKWDIEDFFAWPPDVFALVSSLFNVTGCYRVALWLHGIDLGDGSIAPFWLKRDWQSKINNVSREWMIQVAQHLSERVTTDFSVNSIGKGVAIGHGDKDLSGILEEFKALSSQTTLNHLKVLRENFSIGKLEEKEKEQYKNAVFLAYHLITLNALADSAGRSLGLPYIYNKEAAFAEFYGNLLLTTYGSLSTLPKHLGVVLPKMRTPQSGVTVRGMSHHLTYHVTEIEVIWRTMPWPNQTENTLNILCFPLPLEFNVNAFVPQPEQFQTVRYFNYTFQRKTEYANELINKVIEHLQTAEDQVSRVHIIAFPEMALTENEFHQLLKRLEEEQGPTGHVPFVIAGVRNEHEHGQDQHQATNEVRLAAYFAGSWYQTIQRKHHRWKLDGYQIRQYQLEGRLPTTRAWFEDIPVVQRRLTVVAPNGWLALCPLICEDLAQLEPVAPVIRGIGPTLLVALLSDGPQLKHRWSARYASILADDPGTAVLTLTSKAMAVQSSKLEVSADDSSVSKEVNKPKNWTVALWKDQVKQWYPVNLNEKEGAFLLTIVADWKEEFTLDGRSDNSQAARFRHEGCRRYDFKEPENNQISKRGESGDVPSEAQQSDLGLRIANWTDFREFSALIFALDTIISMGAKEDDVKRVCQWLIEPNRDLDAQPLRKVEMFQLLAKAQQSPFAVGIDVEVSGDPWPTKSFDLASKTLERRACKILSQHIPAKWNCITEVWTGLHKAVHERLKQLKIGDWPLPLFSQTMPPSSDAQYQKPTLHGVRYQLCMIVLQDLHFRLDSAINRSNGFQPNDGLSDLEVKDISKARDLLQNVTNDLKIYGAKVSQHKKMNVDAVLQKMQSLDLDEEKNHAIKQGFESAVQGLTTAMEKFDDRVDNMKANEEMQQLIEELNVECFEIMQRQNDFILEQLTQAQKDKLSGCDFLRNKFEVKTNSNLN